MALSKITNASVADTAVYGRRNLVINGAMTVAQRSTSVTGITSGNYRTVDRFRFDPINMGTWTMTQESDAPDGFVKSMKLACTTADSSPAADDEVVFQHYIEAQNLQHLKYGTSDAETLTLSFWVKSNKTGTHIVWLMQDDASFRVYSKEYTINTANTWEKKTLTFEGDPSGQIDDNTNRGFRIGWQLGAGSNRATGSVTDAWSAYSKASLGSSGMVNLADSTSNNWYITGVQLEVGDTATPFEHRSYGEELALCQRYYFETKGYSGLQNDEISDVIYFPVAMRATPSTTHNVYETNGGFTALTGVDGSTTHMGWWVSNSSANKYIRFTMTLSAEI
jgi:hypothetical protein